MNFWKRLKNWKNYLIHWLGGYSAAEYHAQRHRADVLARRFERITTVSVSVQKEYPPYAVMDKLRELLIHKLECNGCAVYARGKESGEHILMIDAYIPDNIG